jgi:glutaminase
VFEKRFQNVLGVWSALAGYPAPAITFDNATYLSELRTADRNFALAHLLVCVAVVIALV